MIENAPQIGEEADMRPDTIFSAEHGYRELAFLGCSARCSSRLPRRLSGAGNRGQGRLVGWQLE
jgi:hypothetical protein